MNCKPGQLALITRAMPEGMHRARCVRDMIGSRIVKVGKFSHTHEVAGPVWDLEEPFACPSGNGFCVFRQLPDMILTPIDPPQEQRVGDVVDVPSGTFV